MPTADRIERRLWLALQYRAAQNHLEIAPECATLLTSFIHGGVEKIVVEGHENDDVRIALAEANILAFITRMIVDARALNLSRLHEQTFSGAHSALCPLWPFC